MNSTGQGRRRDYDFLRVLSMAAVVYLHTAASDLQAVADPALWQFSNWAAALATAAVPLFFMLSGALLLESPRTDDPGFVLRHRVPKVVVPCLFWSGVVLAGTWALVGGGAAFEKLIHIVHATVLTPYWFLYALVPMYLLSPLLKRMTDHMKPLHWTYLLGLWAVLTLGMQTLALLVPMPWTPLFQENTVYTVSAVGGYLGYFLLGAYLGRLKKLPSRRLLWAVVLADWAVISLGTWYFMRKTGVYGEQFLSYRGLFAAVLATALFLLARSYLERGKGSGRVLTLLSACSFGVYLAHPFAIKVVEALWLRLAGAPAGGIPGQVAVWLGALVLSTAGVVLAASVKPLCYLVTGQSFSGACRESNLFAVFKKEGK